MTENESPFPPSIIQHVSIGTNDFEASKAFYDAVMPSLGAKPIMSHPGAVAYGVLFPELWIQTPIDGEPASVGNGTHIALMAHSKEAVDAFWKAAKAAGATGDGAPGPRPEYTDAYYGCFVRDPDGHKLEATYWDQSKAPAM